MTITITKSGGLGSFTRFGFHYNKAKTSLSHSHSLPIPTPFINEENKGFVKTALINMPLPYACPSPSIFQFTWFPLSHTYYYLKAFT